MTELTETEVNRTFDQLILDERFDLIMQAADAQGVVASRAFRLVWFDEAASRSYALRGFRVPKIGILTYSLLIREADSETSELKFDERAPVIQTEGKIRRETRHLSWEQEQTYLGSVVCRVLGNMIAEGRSEQL